ncbi:MAG: hypothetical protein DRO52_01740 [Candidatus Hecatellales archaeon]|nr:MAG: hypothetical protein DRO52_01740 [Candidatus Hecatellales archaeon]
MLLEAYQFLVGLVVSLSGAIFPGPLLVYVLAKASAGGVKTGPLAVLGHFTVEAPLIILIVLGLHFVLQNPVTMVSFGILGGILLIAFGLKGLRGGGGGSKPSHLSLHPYPGGILFSTVFNPAVPLWWVTLGFALLMDAYLVASMLGVVFWSLGHFTADLVWYTLVAYAAWTGRKTILKHQALTAKICLILLIAFGLYFLAKYSLQALLLL